MKKRFMNNYENKLIKAVLINPDIFLTNKDLFNQNELFKDRINKFLFKLIDEYNNSFGGMPTEEILRDKVQIEIANELQQKMVLDHLDLHITPLLIQDHELLYIENRIKQQLKESIMQNLGNKIDKLSSDELETELHRIHKLSSTEKKYEIINLWDEVENIEREVIKTNLELIDEFGIAKGELGLLMAGTGVGKSVFLSFLANNFMLNGYKVLHIVFEGNKNQYLKQHKIKLCNPSTEELKGGYKYHNLKIVKMKANQTSVADLEDLIKLCIKDNFTPDALVIDYLDCIVINNKNEAWKNDIQIVNDMEHLAQKYQMAVWTAVQSNRSGVNRELSIENISGSISKAQKATLLLTLTRNPMQEEANVADVRVIKNRTGKKSVSLNSPWNPMLMHIELPITQEYTL